MGQNWIHKVILNEGKERYPNVLEVVEGIISESYLKIEQRKQNLEKSTLSKIKDNKRLQWELLFKIGGVKDFTESVKVGEDGSDKLRPEIKKLIMNIYSMETFVYKDLNRASRERDRTKI